MFQHIHHQDQIDIDNPTPPVIPDRFPIRDGIGAVLGIVRIDADCTSGFGMRQQIFGKKA